MPRRSVRAPVKLQRRLRQVAVADRDDGQLLAVGQRLVTRDGIMRRWDGFIAKGAGAAAAERLLRANRLAQLVVELPGLRAAVEKRFRSAIPRSPRWTTAARRPSRHGMRRSLLSATHATRRVRSMRRLPRLSGSRRSGAG